ncbi:MAG: hypothetical protein H0X65_03505 [Gemmatimonadetes bacterium]|nr:hypothetical protein [Gemmatimonadota bacterium]
MRRIPFHRFLSPAVLAAGLLSLAPGAPAAAAAQEPDSARILAAARSAQHRFERIRRNHIPWTWDRGGGPCDERVGRFCIWHTDKDFTWTPPPEPEPIVEARSALIERLDSAAAVLPGDRWIAGQRVRYLSEAGRHPDAETAASECRTAQPGWCRALLGFALHAAGHYARADAAFADALASMPLGERTRWTDLSALLEPDRVRGYRRLSPVDREQFEARFWWLADPLHMLPGNDRRTEHFARHVLDRLQERALSVEAISWGADLRELLLRYGWPVGWERTRARMPGLDRGSIISRFAPNSRSFDPPTRSVEAPWEITDGTWDLDEKRARTEYATPYATAFEEVEHQMSVFHRGDSAIVVTALRLAPDSTGTHPEFEAALALARNEAAAPVVARVPAHDGAAVLTLTVAATHGLLSLEAFAAEAKRAARARYGVTLAPLPPHGIAVSDLLLISGEEPLPDVLADAIPRALGSARIPPGERIGVFWEVYGITEGEEEIGVSVNLLDENAGWLRRVATRVGVLSAPSPRATVRWQEAPDAPDGVHARSLAVELPELAPGRYTLRLTISPAGREPLHAGKTIEVTPD